MLAKADVQAAIDEMHTRPAIRRADPVQAPAEEQLPPPEVYTVAPQALAEQTAVPAVAKAPALESGIFPAWALDETAEAIAPEAAAEPAAVAIAPKAAAPKAAAAAAVPTTTAAKAVAPKAAAEPRTIGPPPLLPPPPPPMPKARPPLKAAGSSPKTPKAANTVQTRPEGRK